MTNALGRKIPAAEDTHRRVTTSQLWKEEERWLMEVGDLFNYTGVAMRISFAVVLLAGCATTGSYGPTDKYFTVEHGTMRFGSAMNRAREHCEKLGMATRHLGTQETGFYMVSRFECVPK